MKQYVFQGLSSFLNIMLRENLPKNEEDLNLYLKKTSFEHIQFQKTYYKTLKALSKLQNYHIKYLLPSKVNFGMLTQMMQIKNNKHLQTLSENPDFANAVKNQQEIIQSVQKMHSSENASNNNSK